MLQCMFIPTSTLLELSEERKCPTGDYLTENGICCYKCSPGTFWLEEDCQAEGQRTKCTPCASGLYTDQTNYQRNCRRCKKCKAQHEIEESPCKPNQNTICRCVDGYYRSYIDSETYQCLRCKVCGPYEEAKQTCTPESNTVCECKENYYRVNKKCEPSPDIGKENLINIIAGVVAVTLVLLVLGIVITHVVTKWFTKMKLQKSSSMPSDVSPDSLEVLVDSRIQKEPSDNNNVKATPYSPVSDQELHLPDCIPLEIKIPDLIYTVLDLVPVLRVKQLVRSLGVKDTEIEQAELDHRLSREAHYQMLRVWAEKGSRAGEMLHRPYLQELLDKLRTMHLGGAAEELETKYGIQ
uniref:Tumor necrosis factor receptor superfamily, member 1a n=1 Tax=Dicentrarchus labrax TaxID=13489 RepID=A0A8C4GDX4_DICLA